jgi:hypothetical protein
MEIPSSLDDVLEMALRNNATSVSLEYDSSGDLEVTYFFGHTGLGVAVSNSADKRRIISELGKRARLGTKESVTIRVAHGGGVRVVRVSRREHFGQWAFDLRFGN